MGEEESDTESDDWDYGSVSEFSHIRRFLLVSGVSDLGILCF